MTIPSWIEKLVSGTQTTDGLFVVTADQQIAHWGQSAERLLGHPAAEVVGQRCYDIVGGHDEFNFRFCRTDCPVMKNARRGRPTENYDLLVRDRAGAERWVNVTILVLPGSSRQEPVVLHLIRDVTKHRHLEERAHRVLATLKQVVAEEEPTREPSPPDECPTPLPQLTRRELEVLRLMACGVSAAQIAESLGITPITARNHMTNIQAKLGVKNRLQAVLYASRHRLV